MAHIIQIKQRIKVVETIKKTTNAMRLISMSLHTRLRQKKVFFDTYKQAIEYMYNFVLEQQKTTQQPHHHKPKKLIIIIGSQKGLCGVFNTQLNAFFKHELPVLDTSVEMIAVGKQIIDFLRVQKINTLATFSQFSAQNFVALANAIVDIINRGHYSSIIVYSNYPHTFFIQKSQRTQLYPLAYTKQDVSTPSTDEYLYEQSAEQLQEYLEQLYLKVSLENLLFESLFAEQAARFIAMDSSTRNAENLLTNMKLDYNKLRQASITRELTDLAGSTLA